MRIRGLFPLVLLLLVGSTRTAVAGDVPRWIEENASRGDASEQDFPRVLRSLDNDPGVGRPTPSRVQDISTRLVSEFNRVLPRATLRSAVEATRGLESGVVHILADGTLRKTDFGANPPDSRFWLVRNSDVVHLEGRTPLFRDSSVHVTLALGDEGGDIALRRAHLSMVVSHAGRAWDATLDLAHGKPGRLDLFAQGTEPSLDVHGRPTSTQAPRAIHSFLVPRSALPASAALGLRARAPGKLGVRWVQSWQDGDTYFPGVSGEHYIKRTSRADRKSVLTRTQRSSFLSAGVRTARRARVPRR
jgi:hypothetical protein